MFTGATAEPGGPHAEVAAIHAAREHNAELTGATLYSTLEPCSHTGRTGPCAQSIIDAGITTVVSAIADPDSKVSGHGFAMLRAAGIDVVEGICASEVEQQLAPYLHHRRTGRPFVMLKMACTLDARTTLPDGPRWITGEIARTRVHQLRAESDAIIVGIGTVLADNPQLTVRDVDGKSPRRIVMTSNQHTVPHDAAVHPCTEWNGDITQLLTDLGAQGVLQVLVEGGPTIARSFHELGLINQYIFHVAPIVCGHSEALPVFAGQPATTVADLWTGHLVSVSALGNDIEVVYESPSKSPTQKEAA
jgi:diaminohydroxyphosphoribosylaminopyrimidine deaminase/5-amino-6-(5-phosphoribosylamino)uracil reductase